VDRYILSLVKSRQWVDTEDSYKAIVKEVSKSLGLTEHLDSLSKLRRLIEGVPLLQAQAHHQQMLKAVSGAINNLTPT
jgi:hypothetical protein